MKDIHLQLSWTIKRLSTCWISRSHLVQPSFIEEMCALGPNRLTTPQWTTETDEDHFIKTMKAASAAAVKKMLHWHGKSLLSPLYSTSGKAYIWERQREWWKQKQSHRAQTHNAVSHHSDLFRYSCTLGGVEIHWVGDGLQLSEMWRQSDACPGKHTVDFLSWNVKRCYSIMLCLIWIVFREEHLTWK